MQAIQNVMDTKEVLLQWFISFLIKNKKAVVLNKINSLQMNFINKLLENLIKEKYIHHLKTISGGGGGAVDLADMQLISKYNKGIMYLLCAINLFSKYAWVIPLKGKKGVTILNTF